MHLILADAAGPLDITFQPNWLGLLIGVVLPVLVGLCTKVTTNAGAKAVLLLLLSCADGLLTEFANAQSSGAHYVWATALITWGGAFIVGVAMHFGLFKPSGMTAWAQRNVVK